MEQNGEPRNGATRMFNQYLTKVQKQFNEGRIAFSTNCAGAGDTQMVIYRQKMNLNLKLRPYTKVNSKWMTGISTEQKL